MNENYFKEMMAKANNYDDLVKAVKGFGYDSLCLRYQIARDAQARLEYEENRKDSPSRDYRYYKDRANRDELRFYEILDGLLGEHN